MSMMVSFVLSFFPRDVLDEILNLIESVSEDFPSYSYEFYEFLLCEKLTRENLKLFEKINVNMFYENISKFQIYFSDMFSCILAFM